MNDSNIIHGFIGMCLGADAGYFAGEPKVRDYPVQWPSRRSLVTAIPMAYFAVGLQLAQIAEFLAECSERFCTPQFDVDVEDMAFASKYLDPETGEVTEAVSYETVTDVISSGG